MREASLLRDPQKASELWSIAQRAYCPNGPEDERLALLRVRIERGILDFSRPPVVSGGTREGRRDGNAGGCDRSEPQARMTFIEGRAHGQSVLDQLLSRNHRS